MKNNKNIIKSFFGEVVFIKQFKKVVNSKNNFNSIKHNFIKSKINNILAFSLIELSIVLIIIGLLVAGITGGASLIESAKITNFISTTRDWQNDVYTFYSLKNRLPGNPKNLSFLGQMINKNWNFNTSGIFSEYKISDFGINDYDGLGANTSVSYCAAFWLDLYLAKISDYKVPKNGLGTTSCSYGSVAIPSVFNGELKVIGPLTMLFDDNKGAWPQFYKAMKGIYFKFEPNSNHIKPKLYYHLDLKIDDGKYDSGLMRGFCYSNRSANSAGESVDYQTAIANGYTCYDFFYRLLDYNVL